MNSVKNIRFTSIVWLLLLPLLAVGKVFLELNSATVEGAIQKPFPISLLDTVSPANIIVAIVITFIATYLTYLHGRSVFRLGNAWGTATTIYLYADCEYFVCVGDFATSFPTEKRS